MLGKQARCHSNPVVHPLIVPGPANGMQRTGFLVRQAVLRESVDVVQELLHLLFLLEQVPGPGSRPESGVNRRARVPTS